MECLQNNVRVYVCVKESLFIFYTQQLILEQNVRQTLIFLQKDSRKPYRDKSVRFR